MTAIKKKQPKTLMLTVLAAAGALAYVFLLFLPGQRALSKTRLELRQKQMAVVDADRLAPEIQKTEELLQRVDEFKTKWKSSAPNEAKVATAFATVNNYAKQAKVRVVRFEPQPTVRLAALSQIPVNMLVEGSFGEIQELLKQLDESSVPIWAKEVHLRPMRENGKGLQCQIGLTIFADNQNKSG